MTNLRWQVLTFSSLILLLAFSAWFPFSSRLFSNLGNLSLVNALIAPEETTDIKALGQSEQFLRLAETWDESNPSAHRGMGFVYWRSGNDEMAFTEWQQTDMTADEFIAFGTRAKSQRAALRWYQLAEYMAPNNEGLWYQIGKTCQTIQSKPDICDRFIRHNSNNEFLDPDFAFGRGSWRFTRRDNTAFAIEECLNQSDETCARVTIYDQTPAHGAGWYQCMHVEEGATYLYSSWVKVDVAEDGQWRPLYYQGSIDGSPAGRWPGTRTGPTDWTYLELVRTMDSFDDQWACFHPLRLESEGEAWFYEARLERLD